MDLNVQARPASLPTLTYATWQPTRDTLHLFVQIVGKIRLHLMPWRNHWWHATLSIGGEGLTTGPIPYGERTSEIAFDFHAHRLVLRIDSAVRSFDLRHQSVATFYRATMTALHELGMDVEILAIPYDCHSNIPFSDDNEHCSYDAQAVEDFLRVLRWTHGAFWQFNSDFYGKLSPVQLFWHSFDLAVTRFSGRAAPLAQGNRVNREAYSHEAISFGFWAGDRLFPEAAFYSYTYPEPPSLRQQTLAPAAAIWAERNGSALATLRYADAIAAADPRAALLAFLRSAYRAGATLGHWDPALTPAAR